MLAWRLSNTLDAAFCVDALEAALAIGRPDIFNTDQGSQFTSAAFTSVLAAHGSAISMDGKGRFMDNIFVERLWRSVKYEEVYLHAYDSGVQARDRLAAYFRFYNEERLHQALGYRTPRQLFAAGGRPVDLWTTLRVAHNPTGPTTTREEKMIMIGSTTDTQRVHNQTAAVAGLHLNSAR